MTNAAVSEEISYLRGRGWNAKQIADRLEVPIEVVMARRPDLRDDAMLEAGQAARREARLVYSQTCPQYGRS